MTEYKRGTYIYFFLLVTLCALTTALAAIAFERTIHRQGVTIVSIAMLVLFFLLYFWISIGFWTATFGFIRGLISHSDIFKQTDFPRGSTFPKTAVVMPIYNEDVCGVFSRLQAMYESMAKNENAEFFDFFVLSDSTDPDVWLEEEQAWASLRTSLAGPCRIYYRHRPLNIGHKSGNIRDFCKHWGYNYRYMIVLDADSLMSQQAIIEMVHRMENDKKIGILQTMPLPVNRRSFFSRLQQFAAHLYGPIFTSGYALWSQVTSTYWGHNAIIRVKAFMDSCGLPKFPGKAPMGGEILSHDFVEAALILKNGWKVVVDHDLSGSYEECPPNLIDFAKRDQRWCQGNLQHLRLIFYDGLKGVSRAQFGMGAMSYLSSPLWAIFLLLVILVGFGVHRPGTPQAHVVSSSFALFLGTIMLLLLPKVWALLLALLCPVRIASFAGPAKAVLGVMLEIVTSIIIAPILMVFHTTFVVSTLLGHSVKWETQRRSDNRVSLADAFKVHAPHTIVGLSVSLLVTWLSADMFLWMMPVLMPLVLSIPISMLLGSQFVGNWLLLQKFLVIPQEVQPPQILRRQRFLFHNRVTALRKTPHPFIRVLVDPAFNALHIALLPAKRAPLNPQRINQLKQIALSGGAEHLSKDERKEILSNPQALDWLHRQVWKDWPLDLLTPCKP